jgi:hypothetical protein
MERPFITDYLGDKYALFLNGNDAKGIYYSVFKTRDPRMRSKPYDMCIQVGGQVFFITKDGVEVRGYHPFPQEELKRAYEYLSGKTMKISFDELMDCVKYIPTNSSNGFYVLRLNGHTKRFKGTEEVVPYVENELNYTVES